jgi:hypothetical protein
MTKLINNIPSNNLKADEGHFIPDFLFIPVYFL